MKDILLQDWNLNKFHHCWLIKHHDTQIAKQDLEDFITENLFSSIELPLENNPDLYYVEASTTNIITVDQIRKLKYWMHQHKTISPFKIAIILEADLMNINAANCCLKIFEDTPKDTYIFLLSKSISKIIITIRSRCRIISIKSSESYFSQEEYQNFLSILSNRVSIYQYCSSMKDNLEKWKIFSQNILLFMNRWIKYQCKLKDDYDYIEQKLFNEFLPNIHNMNLIKKFFYIKKQIRTADNLFLNYHSTSLLLIEELMLNTGILDND